MHAFHWCQSNPETNFGTPMKSNRGKRMEITKCVGVCLHTSSLGVVQTRVNVSYILYICLPVRHLFHLLSYFMFLTLYVFIAVGHLFNLLAYFTSFLSESFNICVVCYCTCCDSIIAMLISLWWSQCIYFLYTMTRCAVTAILYQDKAYM